MKHAMKNDYLNYLDTYGHLSFSQYPFHDADAAIFSLLSYCKLEALFSEPVSSSTSGYLFSMLSSFSRYPLLFCDPVFGPGYRRLFEACAQALRFRQVLLLDAVSHTCTCPPSAFRGASFGIQTSQPQEAPQSHRQTRLSCQFAACTIRLSPHTLAVAFRGTDETINGWLESLNLCILPEVPAQRCAASYLKQQLLAFPEEQFWVMGHSKGANLAIYAAALLPQALQQRVLGVYAFENPGFSKTFLQTDGYRRILPRLYRYLPENSFFGLLLPCSCRYIRVHSHARGIAQHDLNSWCLVKGQLKRSTQLYSRCRTRMLHAKQLSLLSDQQKELLIQLLHDSIQEIASSECLPPAAKCSLAAPADSNVYQFLAHWIRFFPTALARLHTLPGQDTGQIFQALRLLTHTNR